ncbi:MAG: hypothetical protein ACXADF_12650, partial [Candidatus Thorarchaeota archaeon]
MKEYRCSLITLAIIALILSGLGVTVWFISMQDAGPGFHSNPIDDSVTSRVSLTSPLYGGISFDIAKNDGYLDGYNLFNL